jgi:hypothetical protein
MQTAGQVATAELSPADITAPIRSVLRRHGYNDPGHAIVPLLT